VKEYRRNQDKNNGKGFIPPKKSENLTSGMDDIMKKVIKT